jgi:hypothetical protein
MISKSLTLLVLSMFSFPVFSQIEIGVKGGVSFNRIHTTGNLPDFLMFDQKTKIGYFLGATTDIPLSTKWYLTPELYYIQRGNRSEGRGITLGYLALPLNITFFPDPVFGIQAGANLSYLLSYKIGGTRIPDGGEPLDFGIQGGFIFRISKEFSLMARYYHGFSSFYTITLANPDDDLNIRNLNRSVEIGGVFYIEWR